MKQIYSFYLKQKKSHGFLSALFISTKKILQCILVFPFAVIMLMINPIIKIRFVFLFSNRIGHYSLNTELMLCALEAGLISKPPKVLYLFYVDKLICNKQLHCMFKRILPIMPSLLYGCIKQIDDMLSRLSSSYRADPCKKEVERQYWMRDIYGLLQTSPPKLNFTVKELNKAKLLSEKIGLPSGARFVCLMVRDNEYLKQYSPQEAKENESYRNASLKNYTDAILFLANKGYFVIRLGKITNQTLNIEHPNVIDYAAHPLRCDLMDIYLTAHCNFFISTSTGLDSVAQMFKRPVLLTNIALPAELQSWYPHYLFIPKQLKNIHNAHIYKFSEIYSIFLNYKNPLVPVEEGRYLGQVLSDLGLEFIENKAFDILKAVQEMEARLTNTWVENKEQIERQNAFWRTFPHTACQENGREVFGGKIHTKIGSQFLLEHNDLFD